jgi:hypothetical protein
MKHLLAHSLLGMSLGFFLMTQNVTAQNEAIDWRQIAGGGGTSVGGTYSVTGTIGQASASMASIGGNYSITGGFWSLIAPEQNTIAPALIIEDADGNLILHWEAQPGWVLQENHDLSGSTTWTNSFGLVTVNGISYHGVTNPPEALFFRLKRE